MSIFEHSIVIYQKDKQIWFNAVVLYFFITGFVMALIYRALGLDSVLTNLNEWLEAEQYLVILADRGDYILP